MPHEFFDHTRFVQKRDVNRLLLFLSHEGTPFFNFSHSLNRPQKCIRLIAQRLFEMLPDFLFKGGCVFGSCFKDYISAGDNCFNLGKAQCLKEPAQMIHLTVCPPTLMARRKAIYFVMRVLCARQSVRVLSATGTQYCTLAA